MRSTALKQFQRLEAPGSWRPAPDAQLREVVVSIGEATLILTDPKSDAPLTHWSLPAVERLSQSEMPAIYTPASDQDVGYETLEIDDQLMIDAIGRVQSAIAARRPHPGRLRSSIMLACLAVMIVAAAFWLPPALRQHAVRITPDAERTEIGQALLADIVRASGQPCRDATAEAALQRLARRIALPDGAQIFVLRDGLDTAMMLPGGVAIAGNALIAGQDGPEALAGHLLAAHVAAELNDPMNEIMRRVDYTDVLALLTRGALPPDAIHGFGETMLSGPVPRPSDQQLLQGFRQARIPATPYAQTIPQSDGNHLALTEADPFRTAPYPPILSERDWVALQQICLGDG